MNVNKYIGIPYKHGGYNFDGCDCWGLVRLFYQEEFNLTLATESYEETWWKSPDGTVYPNLIKKNEGFLLDLDADNWQLGDVMVFNILSENGKPNHAGVWIPKDEKVLHVQEGSMAVSEPLNRYLYTKLKEVYRHASRL